jgi:hypothetical protein
MDKRIYIHLWKMSFSAQVGYFLEQTHERLLSCPGLDFWFSGPSTVSVARRHTVYSTQKLLSANAARGLSLTTALVKMYDHVGITGFLSYLAAVLAPRRLLREDEATFWSRRTIERVSKG